MRNSATKTCDVHNNTISVDLGFVKLLTAGVFAFNMATVAARSHPI